MEEKPLTKKQKEIYEKGVEDGKQAERLENLSLIKRSEQHKLHDIDELADKKLNDLLGFPNQTYILTHDKATGNFYLGGKIMEEGQVLELKSEAEFLKKSELWKILSETVKEIAERTMFTNSQTFDDMKSGKMLLYHLSFQNKNIELFRKYEKKVARKTTGRV